MKQAGKGEGERKMGTRGEKKTEDCGPIFPLSNKLLSIRRPTTKYTPGRTHRNTRTRAHIHRVITLRGGGWAPRPFYRRMGGGGMQLQSFSPTRSTRSAFFSFFLNHFQLFITNENLGRGEKDFDCFLIFISFFHIRKPSLLHTSDLFFVPVMIQAGLNRTHGGRRGAPIPAFDNTPFLEARRRSPALTSAPTNS